MSPTTPSGASVVKHTAGHDDAVAMCAVGLGKRFEHSWALRSVDLRIAYGRVTALLGPNGAGKSTLLALASTHLRPTTGRLEIAGHDAQRAGAAVRAHIGLVSHRPMLYPDLSAAENLAYVVRMYGLDRVEERVEAALRDVDLFPRRRERVSTLSRGMQQRLALARAMVHTPDMVLLDEPFAGLDRAAAVGLDERVAAAAGRGAAVLVATHDLERAAILADDAVILVKGRVAWSGPIEGTDPRPLRRRYEDALNVGAPKRGIAGKREEDLTFAPTSPRHERSADANRGIGTEPAIPPTAMQAGALSSTNEPVAVFRTPAGLDDSHVAGAPRPVAGVLAVARAVAAKNIRVEWRTREVMPSVILFAVVSMVLLGRALLATGPELHRIAPSALWISLLLGSTLGLTRTLSGEASHGGLAGTLVSPADRGGIFLGTWWTAWAYTTVLGWLLLPIAVALFRLSPDPRNLAAAAGVVLLGAAGWSAAGVLLSAAALGARAREILLPVLLYPLALPLVVPAVDETSRLLVTNATSEASPGAAIVLLAAYALIYVVGGFLLFGIVIDQG